MKAETITGVNEMPLEEGEVKKGKAEKKAGKRIGYNYIVVKSFKESQKNDVVKCLYIKSLTRWGFCVIKEGSYGDTKDKYGRDIIDRLKWQEKLHKELQGKVRIPRLLGSFEENGNYYLVIELIRGRSLIRMVRNNEKKLRRELLHGGKIGMKFLRYLVQIIELLVKLHQNHIIHRDATSGNFMLTRRGKVALIDLELSYSMSEKLPAPPFELGTFGFMSPQQEATYSPTEYEDIFSVGAIIMQIFTSMSPSKLTQMPFEAMEQRVKFFIPDAILSTLVISCLHPNPENRPSLSDLKTGFIQYKKDIQAKRPRLTTGAKLFSKSAMLEIVQAGINTFATPFLADPGKGWFAENTKLPLNPDKHKINKVWYGSFYNGAAGIIYCMAQAKRMGLDIESCQPYIDKGFELIEAKYIKSAVSSNAGMYYGSAGISVTMMAAIQSGLLAYTQENMARIHNFLLRENPYLDYLNGISGQGIAILYCNSILTANGYSLSVDDYVKRLLDTQKSNGSWPKGNGNDGKRIHLSFAYGISGIVYFLLTCYSTNKDPNILDSIKKGLQCLMTQASHYSEALLWRKESKNHYSWWCSGEAGIAQTFIKAYEVLGDASYRRFAEGALKNYPSEIVQNNLSQCHGLSSLGEIYLEAFRVFDDEQYLRRAEWIANLILHCRKKHPQHGTWWQVDHERQPVGGFMVGNSGLLHFLLRFCFSEHLSFPLQPTTLPKWTFPYTGTEELSVILNPVQV
jgi:serine/threonine protein kinase